MTTNGLGVDSSNSASNNVGIMAFTQQPGLPLQYSQVLRKTQGAKIRSKKIKFAFIKADRS